MTQGGIVAPAGRYTVLGASGLLGHHVLEALKDKPGVVVRAVHHTRGPSLIADNIEWRQADLENLAAAKEALRDTDFAILFAGVVASAPVLAKDPVGPVSRLVRICSNSLEAAANQGVRSCVWPGSITAYAEGEGPLVEDDIFKGSPPPNWALLGEAYRFLERMGLKLSEQGLALRVIRPAMVYGENDHFEDGRAHFLPALMRRVIERQSPIEVWGDGTQERDLIHGADVAGAALLALAHGPGYDSFNIASGKPASVNQVLEMLLRLDGFKTATIQHLSDKPTSASGRPIDISRAKRQLGFSPSVGLEEGISRTLAWYRAVKGL